jgi:hypothetical protein
MPISFSNSNSTVSSAQQQRRGLFSVQQKVGNVSVHGEHGGDLAVRGGHGGNVTIHGGHARGVSVKQHGDVSVCGGNVSVDGVSSIQKQHGGVVHSYVIVVINFT